MKSAWLYHILLDYGWGFSITVILREQREFPGDIETEKKRN